MKTLLPLRWTSKATRQVNGILEFIANDSPQSARNMQTEMARVIGNVRAFPDIGVISARISGARELYIWNYVVLYRHNHTGVVILAVVHGMRHWKSPQA